MRLATPALFEWDTLDICCSRSRARGRGKRSSGSRSIVLVGGFNDTLTTTQWAGVAAGREPLVNTVPVEDMFALVQFSDFLGNFIVTQTDETTLSVRYLN
jgi:hypothetical protein